MTDSYIVHLPNSILCFDNSISDDVTIDLIKNGTEDVCKKRRLNLINRSYRWIQERMNDGLINGQMNRINEWMNVWMNKWMYGWRYRWVLSYSILTCPVTLILTGTSIKWGSSLLIYLLHSL